jgi:hypothetical protein
VAAWASCPSRAKFSSSTRWRRKEIAFKYGSKPPLPWRITQPAEVAFGMAAEDLYAALPRELQRALHALPAAVKQLEEEARTMRKRVEEVDGRPALPASRV